MPNLVPPITTVQHALDYRKYLQYIEPNVNFLMSLYLNSNITPQTIIEAKKAGIMGVKSYPAGVSGDSFISALSSPWMVFIGDYAHVLRSPPTLPLVLSTTRPSTPSLPRCKDKI